MTKCSRSLQPQLRFSEYVKPWVNFNIGDCYSFKTTNSLSRENLNYKEGWVKNIHYGDIHKKFESNFTAENEMVPYINKDIDLSKIKKESYLKEGDLVIADASEDYSDIGKVIEIISLSNNKIVAGLHTLLARRESTEIANGFVSQLLKTWAIRKNVMRVAQGAKVLGISTGRYSQIPICIPVKQEQQKIADFLSAVDKKISLLKQKHSLLQQYKKSVMQQLFSQQIRFKDNNGNVFPAWEEGRVDSFVERESKPVQVENDTIYREIGIRSHGKGVFHKKAIKGKELGNKRVFWVHTNAFVVNIVFAWEHAVALTSESEKGFIASHRFPMFVSKNNRVDISFFLLFFLSKRGKYLLELASPGGAGRNKTLGQNNFSELKVTFPCLDEQKKIRKFSEALDKKIILAGQQIELTQTFKKGLLQQMFV